MANMSTREATSCFSSHLYHHHVYLIPQIHARSQNLGATSRILMFTSDRGVSEVTVKSQPWTLVSCSWKGTQWQILPTGLPSASRIEYSQASWQIYPLIHVINASLR